MALPVGWSQMASRGERPHQVSASLGVSTGHLNGTSSSQEVSPYCFAKIGGGDWWERSCFYHRKLWETGIEGGFNFLSCYFCLNAWGRDA
jgi:hypothetical protein